MRAPERLNIILQATDYPPDAFVSSLGLYTQALATALAKRGHRVHVLSRGSCGNGRESDGLITVHRLSASPTLYVEKTDPASVLKVAAIKAAEEWRYRRAVARKMAELVRSEDIDVIEAADASLETILYRPQAFPHVPFIVRMHGPMGVLDQFDGYMPRVGRRLVTLLERKLPLKATHLTTPSHAAKALFRKELKLGDRPVAVLPNMPTFDLAQVAEGVQPDPNLVLFVGRLVPTKGVHLLLQAIPAVIDNHPRARFVFVGPHGPGNNGYRSSLDGLLNLLPKRYHHAVHFTGYRPLEEVVKLYARSAICVVPSLFESFGYACLEGMFCGKAVIASPTGGMAEMLDGGRCGVIYTPPDTEKLSCQILRLLKDGELRSRLGRAARARALMHYHPDLIATAVEGFYRQAIAELRAGA